MIQFNKTEDHVAAAITKLEHRNWNARFRSGHFPSFYLQTDVSGQASFNACTSCVSPPTVGVWSTRSIRSASRSRRAPQSTPRSFLAASGNDRGERVRKLSSLYPVIRATSYSPDKATGILRDEREREMPEMRIARRKPTEPRE